METGVMSESLVVPSDVHQTVTEVLGQLVLDDFKQTDITVKLLQEQVELNLGYSEGSLNKWHNVFSTAIREFFRDVLDAVREYTFISVEIKSVSETFIS